MNSNLDKAIHLTNSMYVAYPRIMAAQFGLTMAYQFFAGDAAAAIDHLFWNNIDGVPGVLSTLPALKLIDADNGERIDAESWDEYTEYRARINPDVLTNTENIIDVLRVVPAKPELIQEAYDAAPNADEDYPFGFCATLDVVHDMRIYHATYKIESGTVIIRNSTPEGVSIDLRSVDGLRDFKAIRVSENDSMMTERIVVARGPNFKWPQIKFQPEFFRPVT